MTNETQGEDFEVIDKRGTEEEAEEQAPIREGVTKKPVSGWHGQWEAGEDG
jgi:hypothetical protein